MLLLVSRMERDERGRWTAVFPRSEMCGVLGLSDKTVKDAVRRLKAHGFIEPVGKSFSGTAQRYRVMPNGVAPAVPLKGVAREVPQNRKGVAETVRKGWLERYERGTATATPIRSKKKEGASPAPSCEGRASAPPIDYGAMSAERNRGIV